ncbi:amino acid transporter, putative [Plasmodium malariae]|uniref:Amino acid transporter, putative n=1 Tax=Plasmodium malariae TaxID=5858 RepID=A0A1C3KDT4_PLAMA|nr:amino acid transporter, putative [Plasmodium malariae]
MNADKLEKVHSEDGSESTFQKKRSNYKYRFREETTRDGKRKRIKCAYWGECQTNTELFNRNAYEHSELFQMEKQNKKDQLNINKYNKSIDIKDDRENQRLKLLKIFKSYHIKYEGHTNLDTLCDYAIYFQDADILNALLKKQNCDNLFYYLVTIGIPYNDIIEMASVFENMKYLKNCNLYMLPWIYKKLNEFHKFDVSTYVLHSLAYSLSTLSCSLYIFIKYKTIAVIFPLFITYVVLSVPFLLQEINCGRYVLDGCISFFWSINHYHLPIGIILLILYTLSIIKCIDLICLHITYISYYFMESTPWVYKNLDIKICSKFNGSKNICDSSRNICYYNDRTQTCEMNRMKLGIKIYDTLLSKYVEPKNTKFTMITVLLAFLFLIFYNLFSKYKVSHKIVKIFVFLLILFFIIHIITLRNFTLINFLLTDFNTSKILSVLLNHEIWIVCMIHCTVNMSLHSGLYFYSSKGLRLDVNVISITYLIVLCCFLVDMLLFVTFTTIIGEHLKNIDKNYYILKKLMKKNLFYILIPVVHNCYNAFTLFLSLNVAIIFLSFMLLSASKRIDILFLSINDIYFFKSSKKIFPIGWIVLFVIYYMYGAIEINFMDTLFTQLSQMMTLLIFFYINFNFFWLRGIKETAEKLGKYPFIFKILLTFVHEFSFLYFDVLFKIKNRVPLYFLRQFINICIIPFISVIMCQWIFKRNEKKDHSSTIQDVKAILRNTCSLAMECTDRSKNIQLHFNQKSKWSKLFNIYIFFFFKYFGLDLVFMCLMHEGKKFFTQGEKTYKKKNLNTEMNPYIMFFLLYLIYVYIVYINIPLFQMIKKKKFFKANHFNILNYPVSLEEKKQEKNTNLFKEFTEK